MGDQHLATRTVVSGLFVGDALCFSDMTLDLVRNELRDFGCSRISGVNELLFLSDKRAAAVRVIVFDEGKADRLLGMLPQLRARIPQANFAMAYRHQENACCFMHKLRELSEPAQVGFLPMHLHIDSWLSVLRLLVNGVNYVPAEVACSDAPAAGAQAPTAEAPTPKVQGHDQPMPRQQQAAVAQPPEAKVHLTEREWQVLAAAAAGKQNKIIADELDLSQHTVKLHMHHVIAKLGVHNRTEAAIWFMRNERM